METLGLRISTDKSIGRHFSRIKSLRLGTLFTIDTILIYGWDIMLLASQTITTLDLHLPPKDKEGELFLRAFATVVYS